jgi:hypothetical protein
VGIVFTREEFMTWPEQDADSLMLQAHAVWLKLASGQSSSQYASLDHTRVHVRAVIPTPGCSSPPQAHLQAACFTSNTVERDICWPADPCFGPGPAQPPESQGVG